MSKKLWQKSETSSSSELEGVVEAFTVGNDPEIDGHILIDDCIGSLGHIAGLLKAGLLTKNEHDILHKGLLEIIRCKEKEEFPISRGQEDCHTAIEQWLTENYGETGKKVHTGRSRNDQVLTAVRLYTRRKLQEVATSTLSLIKTLLNAAHETISKPMAGYTHMQPAMPMTVGLFLSAYAESFLDDLHILQRSYELNDQSPLGSAAGFGSALPIDRDYVSEYLCFSRLQTNALYCQNSRGKIEGTVLDALVAIQNTLSKLATDLLRFSSREFGFIELPTSMTTGSSIMPQKRNPDVLELLRAKSANVWAARTAVQQLSTNLPSGYNRDFQLLKEPLVTSFAVIEASLHITNVTIEEMTWNDEKLLASCTEEIYAADLALEKAQKGLPFRDAYKEAMADLEKTTVDEGFIKERIKAYRTIGSMGNPCLDRLQQEYSKLQKLAGDWSQKEKELRAKVI